MNKVKEGAEKANVELEKAVNELNKPRDANNGEWIDIGPG